MNLIRCSIRDTLTIFGPDHLSVSLINCSILLTVKYGGFILYVRSILMVGYQPASKSIDNMTGRIYGLEILWL
jgi:hypothetical protein